MTANIGTPDKIIRIIAGIVLLSLIYFLDGGIRYIGLLGIIPLATAFMSYCPLYPVFGMSTLRKKPKS